MTKVYPLDNMTIIVQSKKCRPSARIVSVICYVMESTFYKRQSLGPGEGQDSRNPLLPRTLLSVYQVSAWNGP
jgi:hypothetical protein